MNGYYERRQFNPSFPIRAWTMDAPISFRAHWQESVEIIYCLEGVLHMQVGECRLDVGDNSFLVVPPGYLHAFSGGSPAVRAGILLYAPSFPDPLVRQRRASATEQEDFHAFSSSGWLVTSSAAGAAYALLADLSKEILSREPMHRMASRALFNLLLAHSVRAWALADPNTFQIMNTSRVLIPETRLPANNWVEVVKEAIQFIEMNHARPLTLDEAARHVRFNKHHFCRFFRRVTGMTYFNYLYAYRVEMAGRDLLSTDLPVAEIALKHGFGNINSFERIFRRHTGMAPSGYRKQA